MKLFRISSVLASRPPEKRNAGCFRQTQTDSIDYVVQSEGLAFPKRTRQPGIVPITNYLSLLSHIV